MKHRKTLIIYFLLGTLAMLFAVAASLSWVPFLRSFEASERFSTQPQWWKSVGSVFVWLPVFFGLLLSAIGIPSRTYSRGISFLIGTATPYIVVISLLLLYPIVSDYASRTAFDSVIWQQAEITRDKRRVTMVDDLMSQHVLVGKSRSEIDSLLGIPGQTDYFDDYDYVYWLGPERGMFRIDSEWLGLKFKNDTVIEATILRT